MKTIFDTETRDELLERLKSLTPVDDRQWGKMAPSQMMEHTARALEMAPGKVPMKQAFSGRSIGWIFKKQVLGEKPFSKNRTDRPRL